MSQTPQLSHKIPAIVLIGPTAIGKTSLSLQLAKRFNCEIVSVDSVQVYRYLDVGTAKVSMAERMQVAHHLIDIVDPDMPYDAMQFVKDAQDAIAEITAKNKIPLLTGGTGLYFRALMDGIFSGPPTDPLTRQSLRRIMEREGLHKLHELLVSIDCKMGSKIHKNDAHRIMRGLEIYYATGKPWSQHLDEQERGTGLAESMDFIKIGLTCPRETLYRRIDRRTEMMLENGLEEEVRSLNLRGYGKELKPLQSIGYRHIHNYLDNIWTKEEMVRLLARDTRRYAKRQYTWFNKEKDLTWFDISNQQAAFDLLEKRLSK